MSRERDEDVQHPSLDEEEEERHSAAPPIRTVPLPRGPTSLQFQSSLDADPSEIQEMGRRAPIANRYEILGLLGRGGMGNVYRVRDQHLDEIVALKTLRADLTADVRALAWFKREVKLARRVSHPNIVRTFDLGGGDGDEVFFLTMEFIDGESLADLLHRQRPLPWRQALSLALQMARGLSAAHEAGVVHRDLKPANVLLGAEGRVAITDFGIARAAALSGQTVAGFTLSGGGALVGTPLYMAPEQVEGSQEVDHRADLYALGAMLYEMLCGRPPFDEGTAMQVAVARLLRAPPPLRERIEGPLPQGLLVLVDELLQRTPERRPQSTGCVVERLEALETVTPTLQERRASPALPVLRPPQSAPDTIQVAVLPVRDRTSQGGLAHIARGVTEELADALAIIDGLQVKPLGAVLAAQQRLAIDDPLELGRKLGVDVVVEGSLRRRDDRIQVRLSLVVVEEGFQLWGKKFHGTASDVFAICEEAAEAIAEALSSELRSRGKPRAPQQDHGLDTTTADDYMRARHVMQHSWYRNMDEALRLYQRVLSRAPDNPRVLCGAAMAMARQVLFEPSRSGELLERAQELALRSLRQAPDWPEAHYALATIAYNARCWEEAVEHCIRSLGLWDEHVGSHELLGRMLLEVGPLDAATEHLERALHLHEHLYPARWDLARGYALAGQWPWTEALFEMPVLDPVQQVLCHITACRLGIWRDLSSVEPPPPDLINLVPPGHPLRALIHFMIQMIHGGRPDRAQLGVLADTALQEEPVTTARSQAALMRLELFSEMALVSGAPDLAIDALEHAADLGFGDRCWLEHYPHLGSLRGTPRLEAVVERVRERSEPVRAVYLRHSGG